METEQLTKRLCLRIEDSVGKRMQTPKDFDWLAELILEKTHDGISAATLKRIWGYVPSPSTPRTATLDVLCRFVGVGSCTTSVSQKQSLPTGRKQLLPTAAQRHKPFSPILPFGAIRPSSLICHPVALLTCPAGSSVRPPSELSSPGR